MAPDQLTAMTHLSFLPDEYPWIEHRALDFCIQSLLFEIHPPDATAVGRLMTASALFANVFDGPGRDGEAMYVWAVCRWKHRGDTEAGELDGDFDDDDFLVWTQEDADFEPAWRVYPEEEFKNILTASCRNFVSEHPIRESEFASALTDRGMQLGI
jgi:hypothetical protein